MEILFFLGLIWLIITLLGHATWVFVAWIVRSLSSGHDPGVGGDSEAKDLAATHRVISRMASRKVISPDEAQRIRAHVETLAHPSRPSTSRSSRRPSVPVAKEVTEDAVVNRAVTRPADTRKKQVSVTVTPKRITPPPVQPVARPAAASATNPPSTSTPSTPTPSTPTPSARASVGRSLGEFLADHNIRWGELIAGILIVVCSIGLVLSLWETFTQIHRVIPSLIFMGGNAAIFGAGLYTLFRWKLRDTSRATLVIATLLVPLGILAGLSTGGIGLSSVLLDDPITLVSIALAAAVYLTLIWNASRALVGSRQAVAMTVGVAGPSAVLPFVPAMIRMFDASAGWLVYAGSLAAAVAIGLALRTRHASKGDRSGTRLMLLVGTSSFALLVLVGYFAFMQRGAESGWMPIAIAALPGMLVLASAIGNMGEHPKRAKTALTGTITALVGVSLATMILVPAISSMQWMWLWAISFSAAAIFNAVESRRPLWVSIASLPIGLACVASSTVIAGTAAWQDLAVWRRFFGGEPMLASLAYGIVVLLVARVVTSQPMQRLVGAGGLGWLACAVLSAFALAVTPEELMGGVATWCLPILLGAMLLASVVALRRFSFEAVARHERWVGLAVMMITTGFWVSIFRPLALPLFSAEAYFAGFQQMAFTFAATTATGWVIAECLRLGMAKNVVDRSDDPASDRGPIHDKGLSITIRNLTSVATLATCLFAVVSIVTADDSSTYTSEQAIGFTMLLGGLLSWLWIGWSNRQMVHLAIARTWLVIVVPLLGVTYLSDPLLSRDAWTGGLAWWSWAGIGLAIVGAITLKAQCVRWIQGDNDRRLLAPLRRRIGWYRSTEQPWDIGSFGFVTLVTVAAACLAGFGSLLTLIIAVARETPLEISTLTWQPIMVLLLTGLVLQRFRTSIGQSVAGWDLAMLVHLTATAGWIGWRIAVATTLDSSGQLVVATTVAFLGCIAGEAVLSWRTKPDSSTGSLTVMGMTLVAASSLTLLSAGWWPAVSSGGDVSLVAVAAVASWMIAAALATGGLAIRTRSSSWAVPSSLLVPATAFLVTSAFLPQQWWAWLQWSMLAAGVYGVILSRFGSRDVFGVTASMLLLAAVLSGALNCGLVLAGVLVDNQTLLELHNLPGLSLVIFAVCMARLWNGWVVSDMAFGARPSWTLLATFASGHVALAIHHWVAADFTATQTLTWVWLALSGVSTVQHGLLCHGSKFSQARWMRWHASGLLVGTVIVCWIGDQSNLDAIVATLACGLMGLVPLGLATAVDRDGVQAAGFSRRTMVAARALGWFTLIGGCASLYWMGDRYGVTLSSNATLMTAWIATWAVLWRVVCPDQALDNSEPRRGGFLLPDSEAAIAVCVVLLLDLVVWMGEPFGISVPSFSAAATLDFDLSIRVLFACLVVGSVCFRTTRSGMIEVAVTTVLAAANLVALRFAIAGEVSFSFAVTIVCLVSSGTFSIFVFGCTPVCKLIDIANRMLPRLTGTSRSLQTIGGREFAESLLRVGTVVAATTIGLSGTLLVLANQAGWLPVAIASVAWVAICLAELSVRSDRAVARQAAMITGLAAIAMWSSVNVSTSGIATYTLAARWFVSWTLVAAALFYVVPRLIRESRLDRWRPAIRTGVTLSGSLACLSLLATLGQEAWVRMNGQTDLLAKPLVLMTAAMLAVITLLLTAAAVLSGPGFAYKRIWNVSDSQRSALVVAAQLMGGLTWFHLFLCKSPLASLGLRAYWPYVVMALSFASVGITEWARRRKDEVLAKTLSRTALFLPLIPVIGFWISGSFVGSLFGASQSDGWTFIQGRVSYQGLLITATLYYAVISLIWKSQLSRVVSMSLGNLALWVVLMQTAGWDFMLHPQAWLIPPAVCVLVAAHLHRHSLGSTTTAAIRYAATLVIYLSSTADLLIQGIGSTLMGPIVLVSLALLGAGLGVALRVRPFLYLGTTFVFFGVVSMVWHAQVQIGAVWPWWVFGIGTGVLLMIGLMAIEKNKPKMQRIATSLQQWEA